MGGLEPWRAFCWARDGGTPWTGHFRTCLFLDCGRKPGWSRDAILKKRHRERTKTLFFLSIKSSPKEKNFKLREINKCHNRVTISSYYKSWNNCSLHTPIASTVKGGQHPIKAVGPFPLSESVNSTWPGFKVITNPFDIVQTGANSCEGYFMPHAIGDYLS